MGNARTSALSAREDDAIAEAVQAGVTLHRRGLLHEAEKLYQGVLKLAPRNFDALHMLGVIMQQRGDSAEALRLIGAALEVNGRSADALNNHGKALLLAGRFADALASLDQALAIRPDHLQALINRASALMKLERFADAAAAAEAALRLDAANANVWVRLGDALSSLNEHLRAVTCYDKALAIDPAKPGALNNRGFSLGELGQTEQALASYDALLAVEPDHLEALINRGHMLVELQREEEGLASYERALAIAPEDADALFNLGVNRLRLGDLRGWEGYEHRWKARAFAHVRSDETHPPWRGAQVEGTLLVCGEQGLGDQILFSSMLAELLPRARRLAVEIEPRLIPLFARSFPAIHCVPRGHAWPVGAVSAQVQMGSLGRYLRSSWQAFPTSRHGHLRCDPELASRLRRQLADGRTVVGLSWHSRNRRYEAAKSAALREFEPLLRLPGCRFIDLQYGDTTGDRAAVERDIGVRVEHLDEVDNTNDLDALAALITACDMVVTVSNTTAHLAGALGQETFVLVPRGRGRLWYWFKDRADSPWYPRVRLERQRRGQPWQDVVAGVAAELAERTAKAAGPR